MYKAVNGSSFATLIRNQDFALNKSQNPFRMVSKLIFLIYFDFVFIFCKYLKRLAHSTLTTRPLSSMCCLSLSSKRQADLFPSQTMIQNSTLMVFISELMIHLRLLTQSMVFNCFLLNLNFMKKLL